MVAASHRQHFERDGYLVLPGFVAEADCAALRARTAELVAAFDPGAVQTIFSTTSKRHAQNRYFLESGDKIRFFFEEEAFDERGRLRQSKQRSINKVGHALHDLDPVFERFSHQPALRQLVAALGVAEPLLLQSMYIFKQPRIGGEVVCHQDTRTPRSSTPSLRASSASGSRSRARRWRTAASTPRRAATAGRCARVSSAAARVPRWSPSTRRRCQPLAWCRWKSQKAP
jgi:hypothetical protein